MTTHLLSNALTRLVPFDSLVVMTLWELLGFVLWGVLAVSIVLTGIGVSLRSPGLLALAATLSFAFTIVAYGPVGSPFLGGRILLLTMAQVVLTMIVAGKPPKWSWPLLGILGLAGWVVAVRASGSNILG